MPGRLSRLSRILAVADAAQGPAPLSPEELVDILWLAERMPVTTDAAPLALALGLGPTASPAETTGTAGGPVPTGGLPAQRPTLPRQPDGTADSPGEGDRSGAYAAPAFDEEPAVEEAGDTETDAFRDEPPSGADGPQGPPPPRAQPVRIPHPRVLRTPLIAARALRPLKQHRPDPEHQELDEAATAERVAQTGTLDVVMEPGRQRWLDLALVLDDGMSMRLWQTLCSELHTLMRQLGAFRQIRVFALRLEKNAPPALTNHPFGNARSTLPPAVLADPSGRTMVMVVSDGANPLWHGHQVAQAIAKWAACGPTAVVHALPPRMWAGSGLRTHRWQVRSPRPGVANTRWHIQDPLLPAELAPWQGIPVPVLEPDATALIEWTRVVASTAGTAILPLWAPDSGWGAAAGPDRPPAESTDADEPEQDLRRFRRSASPEAYRLACYLAALSPLTVPVMRLVADSAPAPTTTAHLAEVFLGGLLRPTAPPPGAGGPDTSPAGVRRLYLENQVFAFPEPVRNVLLDAVPTGELIRTTRRVSDKVADLIGRAPDFPAWLAHSEGADLLPADAQAFAWLGASVLERLGLTGLVTEPPAPPAGLSAELQQQGGIPWSEYMVLPPSEADAPRTASGRRTALSRAWWPPGDDDPKTVGPFTLTAPLGSQLADEDDPMYAGQDADGRWAAIRLGAPRHSHESPAERARDAASLELDARVRNEIRALERCSHPCVPQLLAAGRSGAGSTAMPWVAMRLVSTGEGGRPASLADLVDESLDAAAALQLAHRLAGALAHCHSVGVVHGRISARRILITAENPFLVAWSGAVVSTPETAPGAAGQDGPTPADDVLALGRLLETAAAPGYFAPAYALLRAVIERCTEPDAAERATAADIAAFLEYRLPRGSSGLPFGAFLSRDPQNPVNQGIGSLRRAPHSATPLEDDIPYPQVPLTPEDNSLIAPAGPGSAAAPSTRVTFPGSRPRRPPRRTPRLRSTHGRIERCVVVIGPEEEAPRSTIAVQLGSALAASRRRADPSEVIMTPLDVTPARIGYHLLADPAAPVGAVLDDVPVLAGAEYTARWVTLRDSNGLHVLHQETSAPVAAVPGASAVRLMVDHLRGIGTVVVSAGGSIMRPTSHVRGVIGIREIDPIVIATSLRPADLRVAAAQLRALRTSPYSGFTYRCVVAAYDTDGFIASREGLRPLQEAFAQPLPLVLIPDATALRTHGLGDFGQLPRRTRAAFTELARTVTAD